MDARSLPRRLRWMFTTILCVAVAAGCAQPQQSDAPDDMLEDGDQDGVPDGKSPQPEYTDGEDDNTTATDANATVYDQNTTTSG